MLLGKPRRFVSRTDTITEGVSCEANTGHRFCLAWVSRSCVVRCWTKLGIGLWPATFREMRLRSWRVSPVLQSCSWQLSHPRFSPNLLLSSLPCTRRKKEYPRQRFGPCPDSFGSHLEKVPARKHRSPTPATGPSPAQLRSRHRAHARQQEM